VFDPSELTITLGAPPSMTATHELVVPKSIPMTLPILTSSSFHSGAAFLRGPMFWRPESARPDFNRSNRINDPAPPLKRPGRNFPVHVVYRLRGARLLALVSAFAAGK